MDSFIPTAFILSVSTHAWQEWRRVQSATICRVLSIWKGDCPQEISTVQVLNFTREYYVQPSVSFEGRSAKCSHSLLTVRCFLLFLFLFSSLNTAFYQPKGNKIFHSSRYQEEAKPIFHNHWQIFPQEIPVTNARCLIYWDRCHEL